MATACNLRQANKFRAFSYQLIGVQKSQLYFGPKGTEILESHAVRDLGIDVSNNASFRMHVTNMVIVCRRKP